MEYWVAERIIQLADFLLSLKHRVDLADTVETKLKEYSRVTEPVSILISTVVEEIVYGEKYLHKDGAEGLFLKALYTAYLQHIYSTSPIPKILRDFRDNWSRFKVLDIEGILRWFGEEALWYLARLSLFGVGSREE